MIDFAWLNEALADPLRSGQAAQQLYDAFQRSPILAGLDDAVAKDLVQLTVMSIWQFVKNGNSVPNSSYLMQSLANKRRDYHRRRQRQLHRETEAYEQATGHDEPVAHAVTPTASEVRVAFDRLRDRAVADRKPHLREKLRADCEQVWELAAGVTVMRTEIEAVLAEGLGTESREVVQDRLLQRHRQARLALQKALDNLVAEGKISNDQHTFYKMLLERLLRRQIKRASDV